MTKLKIEHLPGRKHLPPEPLVSVVMPTYKRAGQIGQSIQSLLNGKMVDFELLIRDDGSGDDGTEQAVIAAANGDSRVNYHRNPSSLRMPGNLNSGILAARGKFIAVCHDHDVYKPDFLEVMVNTLEKFPTALFVHCAIDVIGQNDEYKGEHIGNWQELTDGKEWLKYMLSRLSCPVCALTVVRRSAHEEYGLYDSTYGFISDVELWMRLSLNGDVAYVKTPLIRVREREEDHFATKAGMHWTRVLRDIHRQYSLLTGFQRLSYQRLKLEQRFISKLLIDYLAIQFRRFKTKRQNQSA